MGVHTHTQTYTQRHIHTNRHDHTSTHRHIGNHADTQTHSYRDRHKHTQVNRDTHVHVHTWMGYTHKSNTHTPAHLWTGTCTRTHTDWASQLSSHNTVLELDVWSAEHNLHQPHTKSSMEKQQLSKSLLFFLATVCTMCLSHFACVWGAEARLSNPRGAHRVPRAVRNAPPLLNLLPPFGMTRRAFHPSVTNISFHLKKKCGFLQSSWTHIYK